jgi:hypothetical protein
VINKSTKDKYSKILHSRKLQDYRIALRKYQKQNNFNIITKWLKTYFFFPPLAASPALVCKINMPKVKYFTDLQNKLYKMKTY